MNCRKSVKGLVFGALAAVAPLASAQTMDNQTKGADSAGMSSMSSSTMAPTALTGTVLRYYTDRSGYVTAMDVQTAEGVRMVRFAPNMAQRLYTTYPVGGQATVYVQSSPMMGMSDSMRYDVVGYGPTAPTYVMQPYMVRDVDLLDAEPQIMIGTKLQSYSGRLNSMIHNESGEVVGLVLNSVMSDGNNLGDNVLVRVGRMFRQINPGAAMAGSPRVAPAFKGSEVMVTGYAEAPMYGVVSAFPTRVIANAITLNGRGVGPLGFPNRGSSNKSLLSLNIGGGGAMTPEEVAASGQGYMTYQSPAGGATMNSGAGTTGTGTMGTGTTGGM